MKNSVLGTQFQSFCVLMPCFHYLSLKQYKTEIISTMCMHISMEMHDAESGGQMMPLIFGRLSHERSVRVSQAAVLAHCIINIYLIIK